MLHIVYIHIYQMNIYSLHIYILKAVEMSCLSCGKDNDTINDSKRYWLKYQRILKISLED